MAPTAHPLLVSANETPNRLFWKLGIPVEVLACGQGALQAPDSARLRGRDTLTTCTTGAGAKGIHFVKST